MNMLFAPAEQNPYDWWLIVSERNWNERQIKALGEAVEVIRRDIQRELYLQYMKEHPFYNITGT